MSNFRLVLAVGLSAAVLVSAGCKSKKTADDYLNSADHFQSEQQYEKARIEYRNALVLDPNSARAHYGLATVARMRQDQGALLFHLERAAQLDPTRADIQFEYGELAILTGNLQSARHAEKKLNSLIPGSAQALELSLALAVAEERWADAKRLTDEGISAYPKNAEIWGLAAVAAKKQKLWDQALEALDQAIVLSKEPLQYRLLRIDVNQQRGDQDATIQDLSVLIEKSDIPEAQILQLTKLIYDRDGEDAALQSLMHYIQQYPEAYSLQTLHVDLIRGRDQQAAGVLLNDYIEKAKNPKGLLFYRVYAAFSNDNIHLAKNDLTTILSISQNDEKAQVEARALLGEIAWLMREWKKSEEHIDQVLHTNSSHKAALLLKAKLLLQKNEADQAIPYLNKLLSIDRQSTEAMTLLAGYYQALGRTGVATDFYQKILEINPNHYEALRFAIAEAYGKGHYANADGLLRKALQAHPDDIALLNSQLQLVAIRQQYKEAETILERLRALSVDESEIAYLSGFIKQKKGLHKDAIQDFSNAIRIKGSFDKALQALVSSAQAIQDSAGLKHFLSEHTAAQKDDLTALLLHTRLADETELPKAMLMVDAALKQHPNWGEGAVLLAELLRRQGDENSALNLLHTQYQSNPNAGVGIAYARFLQNSANRETILALYEDLLQNYSDNEVIRNNYALYLLKEGSSAQEHRKALQLTEGFSNSENPALLDTYGQALLKTNNTSRAIFTFKKALSIADIPDIHLNYAQALFADQKIQAAKNVLEALQTKADATGDQILSAKVMSLKQMMGQGS